MRKNIKTSFADLVNENRQELLNDEIAMEEIEDRLDNKHFKRLKES